MAGTVSRCESIIKGPKRDQKSLRDSHKINPPTLFPKKLNIQKYIQENRVAKMNGFIYIVFCIKSEIWPENKKKGISKKRASV